MTSSGLPIFMSLVGVQVSKVDPKKSQWVVTTPTGVQVFTSLMGVQAPNLDLENS